MTFFGNSQGWIPNPHLCKCNAWAESFHLIILVHFYRWFWSSSWWWLRCFVHYCWRRSSLFPYFINDQLHKYGKIGDLELQRLRSQTMVFKSVITLFIPQCLLFSFFAGFDSTFKGDWAIIRWYENSPRGISALRKIGDWSRQINEPKNGNPNLLRFASNYCTTKKEC